MQHLDLKLLPLIFGGQLMDNPTIEDSKRKTNMIAQSGAAHANSLFISRSLTHTADDWCSEVRSVWLTMCNESNA